MRAADVMETVRKLIGQRQYLTRKIGKLTRVQSDLRSPNLDGMPRGTLQEKDADEVAEELCSIQQELDRVEMQLHVFSDMLSPVIGKLTGAHKKVMTMRYLGRMPMHRVSVKTAYEERHVRRLMREAEQQIGGMDV